MPDAICTIHRYEPQPCRYCAHAAQEAAETQRRYRADVAANPGNYEQYPETVSGNARHTDTEAAARDSARENQRRLERWCDPYLYQFEPKF